MSKLLHCVHVVFIKKNPKTEKPFFLAVMQDLYDYVNPRNGKHSPLISKRTFDIIMQNKDVSNLRLQIF